MHSVLFSDFIQLHLGIARAIQAQPAFGCSEMMNFWWL